MSNCVRCFLEYRDEQLSAVHPDLPHARICRACSRAVRQIIGWLEFYGVVIQYAASHPPSPLITKSDIPPMGVSANGHVKTAPAKAGVVSR